MYFISMIGGTCDSRHGLVLILEIKLCKDCIYRTISLKSPNYNSRTKTSNVYSCTENNADNISLITLIKILYIFIVEQKEISLSFNIKGTILRCRNLLHLLCVYVPLNFTSLVYILMHNDAYIKSRCSFINVESGQDVRAENATSKIISHGFSDDGGLIESLVI